MNEEQNSLEDETVEPSFTIHDIIWASRYYLGHELKDADISPDLLADCETPQDLRDRLYGEALRRRWPITAPMAAKFTMYRPGAKRILVLGNCQGPNLARALSATTDASVFGVEVMLYHKDPDYFEEAIDGADLIVAPRLGEDWGSIGTQALLARRPNDVVTYSLLYFDGLQPDMTYWGVRQDRVQSPFGDYHSKIILRSFFKGYSVERCLQEFNEDIFGELGFWDAAEKSLAEMRAREVDTDIRCADFLEGAMRKEPCFHTMNHPRQTMFTHLAFAVCEYFGLKTFGTPLYGYNALSGDVIWPVYREIAERHRCWFMDDQRYWRASHVMTREEFVWRSYKIYGAADRDVFWNMAPANHQATLKI